MDHLRDIALFVEVARQRSFSRAAAALEMPNSSLSRRIARLEHAIGVKLFHRTSRRVELTEPGQLYFERCLGIVEEAAIAHESLTAASTNLAGRLRISVPVDFGNVFLAPLIIEFARLYPQLSFELDLSPRRVDLLAEHFDLAIRVGALPDSNLLARQLATVRVSLYASPEYLARRGRPTRPAQLAQHSCLRILQPDQQLPWRFARGARQIEVKTGSRFAVNNISMLRQLTVAGMGIGAVDDIVADADLKAGRIVRVLSTWSMPPLPIRALTTTRLLPARVRLFIEFVTQRLRCFDRGKT